MNRPPDALRLVKWMRACMKGAGVNPWKSGGFLRERVCGSRRDNAETRAGEAAALFVRARQAVQTALDAEARYRHAWEPLMHPGRGRRWRQWEEQVCAYLDARLDWDAIFIPEEP